MLLNLQYPERQLFQAWLLMNISTGASNGASPMINMERGPCLEFQKLVFNWIESLMEVSRPLFTDEAWYFFGRRKR